jgi:trehalose 6-phosphate phosphatase
MAVELRPPVPVDKGTVVEELTAGTTVAAFAGDDAGDLPAFAAIVDLVRAGKLASGVRVGVASAEAPAEILSADVVVDGPPALAELLGALALAIKARA